MGNSVLNIISKCLYPVSLYLRSITGTVVVLFLARYLSVYDYGLFSSYRSIATFCLMFANLSFADYILVSSDKNVKEIQLKIGLFILNAILLMLLIFFGSLFSSLEMKVIFALVLLRQFLDSTFFALIFPYFQAANKFNVISYVNIFYTFVMLLITFICYVNKYSLYTFLILNIMLGVINFIQVSYYAKIKYLRAICHFKRLFKKIDKTIVDYAGVTLCSYLYNQIPALFVSTYLSKEDAALYFSAYTFALIISLLIGAQVQKMVPEMINATKEKITKIISFNVKFLMSVNALIFVFFFFFGKPMLKLLYKNPYYQNAYSILLVLTISNIFIALAGIYGAYLTASGNQKLKVKMQSAAIVITVLSLLLTYKAGINSAILAYFLSAGYIGFSYTYKAKQILKNLAD